jgi:serine acetyltransferase/thymidylate kinase
MDDRGNLAQSLFDFLERNEVSYCVLGDTRLYPMAIASDVDIAVGRRAYAQIPHLLSRFCRENEVRMVQLIEHEQTATYFVLAWMSNCNGLCFLAVDVCSDYLRGGRPLLSADEILAQNRIAGDEAGCYGNFRVPLPHVQFIYYLLKKIDKQDLSFSHGDYLTHRWRADPCSAWGEICRFWPLREDAELLADAAASGDWSAVRNALPKLRRSLHRATPLSIAGVYGELCRRVRRAMQPTGLVVSLLGPDGCGKSSVIQRMLVDLSPVFRRTGHFHLRPRVFASSNTAALPVTNPHALPVRGRLASLAKLGYFISDYIAGYFWRVWPLTAHTTLVVFDRYFHDLLVDPRRYRYGGPKLLARWAAKCVPAPDMWILLDAPVEVLQARKAEVSVEETERQRHEYFKFVNRLWNSAVIDAARNLDAVAIEAELSVLRFLEARLEHRYPAVRFKENPVSARLLQFFCSRKVPVLSKLFRILFNSDIYCRIRSPILMPHPYGITIHGLTVIGSRVTIMQQVTLGGKDLDKNEAPIIEDDVYIGAGAKVLGAVRVGRGAVIGANAVITRDVAPYCTVVGANRIVRSNGRQSPGDRELAATLDLSAYESLRA